MNDESAKELASNQILGIFFILLGSVLLSAKGIFAKLLYQHGLDFIEVASIRAILALPLFWLWAAYRSGLGAIIKAEKRLIYVAAASGFFCYYMGGFVDFYALTIIDASLERVLLYTYPAIIVVVLALKNKRLPSKNIMFALGFTWLGVILAIGGVSVQEFIDNWFGSLLVLLCAFTYAAYFFANEYVGKRSSSEVFTVIAMTASTMAMAIHYFVTHYDSPLVLNADGWNLFFIMAVFVTVIPLFLLSEGVRRIGAQRGSLLSTIGPPSTIIMASFVLSEQMTVFQIFGVICVLSGIYVLERFKPELLSPNS